MKLTLNKPTCDFCREPLGEDYEVITIQGKKFYRCSVCTHVANELAKIVSDGTTNDED